MKTDTADTGTSTGTAADDTPDKLPPDLAALMGLASASDAALDQAQAVPLPPGQEAPTLAMQGDELGSMLKAVVLMAGPVAPYIPKAYDDATCDRIGVAIAAVAEKYQWDLGKVMGPEVMLAFVTIPPTIGAVQMAREYYAWKAIEDAKAGRAQKAAQQAAQPVAVPVDGG
jgi:hypothetical protein